MDSYGQTCGIDPAVKDKPYLFFFDPTKCVDSMSPVFGCNTPQVCVERCPEKYFHNNDSGADLLYALKYCQEEFPTYDTNKCPEWFLESESYGKRCVPVLNETSIEKLAQNFQEKPSNFYSNVVRAADQIKISGESNQFKDDFVNSKEIIVYGALIAIAVCMIYILSLRYVAGFMVWASIGAALSAVTAATIFLFIQYKKTGIVSYLVNSIFGMIFVLITLLVVLYMKQEIKLAISMIKEASRAISDVPSALFFPVVLCIIQLGWMAFFIGVFVYLSTNHSESCIRDAPCSEENSYDSKVPYFHGLNIFGVIWMTLFISALCQMVLANIFSQWYWTFEKRNLPFFTTARAFYTTIRYHVGTIAFGSLLIGIFKIFVAILRSISRVKARRGLAILVVLVARGLYMCFRWSEKFLKFISKNAYIMCAINGKNFCASAKDAFVLLVKNVGRVIILNNVLDCLFLLSKILVTAGVGALVYVCFFMNNTNLKTGMNAILITIMVLTYLVAALFFGVYRMAVDTIFLCFLLDMENNDGSAQRPYYMSGNLMKLFIKKKKQV